MSYYSSSGGVKEYVCSVNCHLNTELQFVFLGLIFRFRQVHYISMLIRMIQSVGNRLANVSI